MFLYWGAEMANETIRRQARAEGIPFWLIAKRLSISEPTMTRRMREEMPEEEKQRVLSIIREISQEARNADNGEDRT